ncbi:MAG: autotransporter domain-containing protein [Holosporales bacterium]
MVFFLVAVLMLLAASGEARAACPSPGTVAVDLILADNDENCGPYNMTGTGRTASIADGASISFTTPADTVGITVTGGNNTINNSGSIVGSGTGSAVSIGVNTISLTNVFGNGVTTGVIGGTGAGNGITITAGTLATLTNLGTIRSGTGSALRLDGTSSITTIEGTGTFTSSGTTNATVLLNSTGADTTFGFGGTIINTASSSSAIALSIAAAPISGTITNQGIITASGAGTGNSAGRAVNIGAETTFVNDTSGVINGRITQAGDVDIIFENRGSINGNVLLEGDGAHTLLLTSGSINGTVTGGDAVDTLTLNGGAINGAINLGEEFNIIEVNGAFETAGTIQANSLANEGSIDLRINDGGYFTVNNTVTLGSDLTPSLLTIASGGTLNINGANVTSTGALSNSGTIMIAAGQTLTTATQNYSSGLLSIGVNPSSAGQLIITGTPDGLGGYATDGGTDLTDASIAITVATGNGFIPVGTQFKIIDANNGGTGFKNSSALPTSITVDSLIYKFVLSQGVGSELDDVFLTVTGSASSVATNPNNANVANILTALGTTTSAQLTQIQNNLINASTTEEGNRVLESTRPTVDGGVNQSTLNVNNQVQGITTGRLEHIREGFNNRSGSIIRQNSFASSLSQSVRSDDSVGFSNASYNTVAANSDIRAMLGNNETRVSVSDNVWLQGFGQKATQNTRDFIQGYDATTYGIIMGADTHEIFDSGTVGIAFNYGKAKIDSKNAADARNNVDSYGVIVYGTHPVTETVFFDGQLGYNFNQIDSTRNNVGGTGLTAKANYGANQYSARGLVGKDYQVGSGFMVTPTVSLTYTRLAVQGFTETGASGANLKVNSSEYNILDLGLGVRAERVFTTASGMQIRPSAHAGYRYDMIGDKIQTTSTFTGGGPAFTTTGGEAQKSKFNIGGGIGVGTLHDWQLSAEYDYEIQTDYSAHSGFLRASSPF